MQLTRKEVEGSIIGGTNETVFDALRVLALIDERDDSRAQVAALREALDNAKTWIQCIDQQKDPTNGGRCIVETPMDMCKACQANAHWEWAAHLHHVELRRVRLHAAWRASAMSLVHWLACQLGLHARPASRRSCVGYYCQRLDVES